MYASRLLARRTPWHAGLSPHARQHLPRRPVPAGQRAVHRPHRRLVRRLAGPEQRPVARLGEQQIPSEGVWAVEVDGHLKGVANLGTRPTVGGGERLLEVHLLDFSGDLYGKSLKVRFVKFLRGERTFGSLDELKAQIRLDAAAAADALGFP